MAMSLVCGRAQLLRLLRPQHSFHRVAGSPRPLATQLPVAALLGSGRPPYALLAALRPRCISTSAAFFAEAQVQPPPVVPAPSAPPAPPVGPEVAAGGTTDVVQCAAEQSFSELGLGSYTPVGLLQNLLEFMHIDMGLPWWGAIMTCTVLARCLAFPLIVKGQREAAKIHNHLPMLQKFSIQIRDAKLAGDHIEFYRASLEMTSYQKKHDINFLRPLILPLTQAPLFLSFFLALKEMANLPVPSLQTGGLWWFQDLSVSDPTYALPLVVAVTMWTVIELGAETGTGTAEFRTMKNVFRFLPLMVLPMTIHFPAAVFMYWFTSNMFSLCQMACLQIPAVRTALKIPARVVHEPDKSLPQEGFFKSFKKGWKNAEITHQLKEREYRMKNHLDLAARGPLQQTFTHNPLLKHDPTHPPNTPNSSSSSSSSKPKSKPWHDTLG